MKIFSVQFFNPYDHFLTKKKQTPLTPNWTKCESNGMDKELSTKLFKTLQQTLKIFGEVIAFLFENLKKNLEIQELTPNTVNKHLQQQWNVMRQFYQKLPAKFRPRTFAETKSQSPDQIGIYFCDNAHQALNKMIISMNKAILTLQNAIDLKLETPSLPIAALSLPSFIIYFLGMEGFLTNKYIQVLKGEWFNAIKIWSSNQMSLEYKAIHLSYCNIPELPFEKQFHIPIRSSSTSFIVNVLETLVLYLFVIFIIVYISNLLLYI